jgi:hypothetical protein
MKAAQAYNAILHRDQLPSLVLLSGLSTTEQN